MVRIIKVCSIAVLGAALLMLDSPVAHANAAGGSEGATTDQQVRWWTDDVWKDPERGFHWEPPEVPPKKPKPKDDSPASKAPRSIRELRTFAEVDKELKRLRELAVFEPSQENVLTYLRAQEYVLSQSSVFADTARRVVWQNPDVDYQNRNPVATYSQTNRRARDVAVRRDVLAALGKSHGLLFFFRSDCPFCHDMAPVVRTMTDQYGIEVLAVSLDGRGMPAFPNPRPDNGISRFVTNGAGVDVVPALYLVSNDKKTVVPLGTGALALDEIAERIRVLMTTKPGQEF